MGKRKSKKKNKKQLGGKKGGGAASDTGNNKNGPSASPLSSTAPTTTTTTTDSPSFFLDTFFGDDVERPYQDWYGRELVLAHLRSPLYRGKKALCVGYDLPSSRIVVWVLHDPDSDSDDNSGAATTNALILGNEITVDPTKCSTVSRWDKIDDCRKEIRRTQPSSPKKKSPPDDNDNVCSICLETPRNPMELPCRHRFCGSCIARLRPPRHAAQFELRCPNCREVMPAMFDKLLERAWDLSRSMAEWMMCDDPGCIRAGRHGTGWNGMIMSEEVGMSMKAAMDRSREEKTALPLLQLLEQLLSNYAKAGARQHPDSSPVQAHRELMRNMVCRLWPEVKILRRQYEGCFQVRTTCGEIDSQLEEAFQRIYDKPLLTLEEILQANRQEEAAKSVPNPTNDMAFTRELSKIVLKDLEAAWCYIHSFGLHYGRFLLGFSNAVGELIMYDHETAAMACQDLVDEKELDRWTIMRLRALEDLLETPGAYGSFEANEAYNLIKLLFNAIILPCFRGVRQIQLDRFTRIFGQEYIHRELEGGVNPNLRMHMQQLGQQIRDFGDEYVSEDGCRMLLVRPCFGYQRGINSPGCLKKEFQPNQFMRCGCKRRVYCSPGCMMMNHPPHEAACKEAQQAHTRFNLKTTY